MEKENEMFVEAQVEVGDDGIAIGGARK